MGAPRRVLLARGSSACAWGLGAEGWGLGAGSWSLDPTLGPFPCPNLQAGLWASPCVGAAGCKHPQRRQEAAPEPSRRGRGVGCHFINHQAPFKDGVLTFPAPAWGFISSFISCSNNSSRSPGRAARLRFQLCRVPGSGPSLLMGCTLLWGGGPGDDPLNPPAPCRGSPAPFLALWGDANKHHVPHLPSARAVALMGWGRGWGQVWGQRWHCRGCSCWLPAPPSPRSLALAAHVPTPT